MSVTFRNQQSGDWVEVRAASTEDRGAPMTCAIHWSVLDSGSAWTLDPYHVTVDAEHGAVVVGTWIRNRNGEAGSLQVYARFFDEHHTLVDSGESTIWILAGS